MSNANNTVEAPAAVAGGGTPDTVPARPAEHRHEPTSRGIPGEQLPAKGPDNDSESEFEPAPAHILDLLSQLHAMTAELSAEAFDRLGGAMESAIQQTRSRKTIRVAGQGLNQRSRYDTAVHSFVSELSRELIDLIE